MSLAGMKRSELFRIEIGSPSIAVIHFSRGENPCFVASVELWGLQNYRVCILACVPPYGHALFLVLACLGYSGSP